MGVGREVGVLGDTGRSQRGGGNGRGAEVGHGVGGEAHVMHSAADGGWMCGVGYTDRLYTILPVIRGGDSRQS